MQLDHASISHVLASNSYREFIRRYLDAPGRKGAKLTYSALARRAGFAARSFPRDVVHGNKRISPSSLEKFSRGLGLKGELKSYFELLVALEEPEVNQRGLAAETIRQRLRRLSSKILSRLADAAGKQAEPFYENPDWIDIYASLGSPEKGSTLDEVARRSRIPSHVCKTRLAELQDRGVAHLDSESGRYYPRSLNFSFDQLGTDQFFKTYYLHTADQAIRQAKSSFASSDKLFFNSVFSIKQERIQQFREEMRSLLLNYVEDFEEAEGERIAKLSFAFWPS